MKKRNKPVIPGFGLSMGITISILSLVVLIPLASLVVYTAKLSFKDIIETITRARVLASFYTSFVCAFAAAVINGIMGTILAWVLVKYDFPGKRLMDGMIELPFALPTAVAGITLSKMYAEDGMIGRYFAHFGIKISYTRIGLLIALVFIGIPFIVRAVQPVLEKMDDQYEEAAYMLGATPTRTFFKVILPELRPALLTGFGLAFARGIGEYGSVIYISGNSAKEHTQMISYVIMQKLNYIDYKSATAIPPVRSVLPFRAVPTASHPIPSRERTSILNCSPSPTAVGCLLFCLPALFCGQSSN